MRWSKQKLALTGFAAAAGLVALGRWGLPFDPKVREQDVLAVFAGGFVAGLAFVRFVRVWRAPPSEAAAASAAPPKTKQ